MVSSCARPVSGPGRERVAQAIAAKLGEIEIAALRGVKPVSS